MGSREDQLPLSFLPYPGSLFFREASFFRLAKELLLTSHEWHRLVSQDWNQLQCILWHEKKVLGAQAAAIGLGIEGRALVSGETMNSQSRANQMSASVIPSFPGLCCVTTLLPPPKKFNMGFSYHGKSSSFLVQEDLLTSVVLWASKNLGESHESAVTK